MGGEYIGGASDILARTLCRNRDTVGLGSSFPEYHLSMSSLPRQCRVAIGFRGSTQKVAPLKQARVAFRSPPAESDT